MTPAPRLRFVLDWDSIDEGVRAAELRATFAHLQVWVDDSCVTLVEDSTTNVIRKFINVCVYPLAEWIAYNWWVLALDGRPTSTNGRLDRRNMRAAGDGFEWPDLTFVSSGDVTRVSWCEQRGNGQALRYLQSGERWLPRGEVVVALESLLVSVIARLSEAGVGRSPLHEEWDRLQQLDSEETEFCQATARLGLDPFSEGIDFADRVEYAFSVLDEKVISDFLDVAPVNDIEPAARWVNAALERARVAIAPASAITLSSITQAVESNGASGATLPWEAGYEAARQVRRSILSDAIDRLSDLPSAVLVHPAGGTFNIGAVGCPVSQGSAVVLPRDRSRSGVRFAQARSLWHAAAAPSFVLTDAGEWNQQAGRAFAAELLAPAEGILALVDDPRFVSPDMIEMVAAHFEVSEFVVNHQLENQRLSGSTSPS